jgi:GH25 family lysozyme M1 (1,4-beta-N-acetylmuramidase)
MAFLLYLPTASFAASRVDFIDVSHWNNSSGLPLSFYQTLKAGGIDSVVVKVSDGTNYIDPSASVNVANAKQAGMIVNAYHFARLTSNADATNEAKWFDRQLRYVGFDKLRDGIVVVDVEVPAASRNKLTEYTNTFISAMHQLGYPTVDVYTGSSFYLGNLDASKLSVKDPWLARYNGGTAEPSWLNGNKGAWQWASDYHFAGISGNFDVSQDFAGKYTNTYVTPNATPTGETKKIGSVSLVNWMKSKGMAWSYDARTKLAVKYGIANYSGTAAQNLALLSKLKSGVKPVKLVNDANYLPTSTKKIVLMKKAYLYRGVDFKSKYRVREYAKGTKFTITGYKRSAIGTIRLRTKSGYYITANKKYAKAAKASKSSRKYTVRAGDALWSIAHAKHTTVVRLKSLNKLHSNVIHIGDKLNY